MIKTNEGSVQAQGAETQAVTPEAVQKWVTRDLASAIHMLDAIHRDPDLCKALSDFMYGRYMNHLNAMANPSPKFD